MYILRRRFSVSNFICIRIHSLKPASRSLMSFPTSGCNYRHWVDFFSYCLILQRWEDSENQLNEEHLLNPADPQEALSVPDISQPVGQLQSQLKHWCLGSRRPWAHQALPQLHQRVVEGSPSASRNSLQDSLIHSQGRWRCTVVVRRKIKKVIFAGKIVRHRWVAPKW